MSRNDKTASQERKENLTTHCLNSSAVSLKLFFALVSLPGWNCWSSVKLLLKWSLSQICSLFYVLLIIYHIRVHFWPGPVSSCVVTLSLKNGQGKLHNNVKQLPLEMSIKWLGCTFLMSLLFRGVGTWKLVIKTSEEGKEWGKPLLVSLEFTALCCFWHILKLMW